MNRPSRDSASDGTLSPERRAVFAATALAVAQPIFDQLGRNPEFLWLREVSGLRLWAFGLGIFLGVPGLMILLAEVAGRVHPPFRRLLYRLWLWLGLGLLALVGLRLSAPDLGTAAAFAAAAIAAAASVWIHARSRLVRELGNILSLLVWAVPLLFLLRPEVRSQHKAITVASVPAATGQAPPIVLVVWDELPSTTLMTATGEIDGDWFPGFARLASTSTWFRDTLTTSTLTLHAMPALLTGRAVDAMDQGAGLTDPRTVFRLVEASHQRFAYSAVVGIVPRGVSLLGDDGAGAQRWSGWLEDLWILYLHLTMPRTIREDLAPVSAAWGEFGKRETEEPGLRCAIDRLQVPDSRGEPLFAYFHSALPHHPWTYLPSGARYWSKDHLVAPGLSGFADTGHWTGHPWLVAQAYQRHLLQSMYADRLLAKLIDRLVELDLWDSALVVVTADHGASFTPGRPLRIPTDSTVAEVAAVPLFVKLPGQTESRIDDRRASILDILPTIADAYGQDVPWPIDGVSLLREDRESERERWVDHPGSSPLRVTRGLLDEILAVARTRRQLFGRSGTDGQDPFRIGPYSGLVGRSLSEFEILSLSEPWSAERVEHDLDKRLNTRLNAARLSAARLELSFGARVFEQPTAFAVVVDDEIVATTAAFPGGGPSLSVLVPEEVVPRISESLRLLRIVDTGETQPRFAEVSLSTTTYRLSSDGAWIVGGDGERWKVDPHAFRGEVHMLKFPFPQRTFRVLAWGVDDQDRAPERLVAFSGDRSIGWAPAGVPKGDFLDYLQFSEPEERIFYLTFPRIDMELRYFVLGADGRAGELALVPDS